jgi:hypothetical protein
MLKEEEDGKNHFSSSSVVWVLRLRFFVATFATGKVATFHVGNLRFALLSWFGA